MSHPNELPTFAELTASNVEESAGDRLCPEGITAARQWLRNIERECARLTAEYRSGNTRVKFDFDAVYDRGDARLAEQHGIDYMGVCLLHNETYERNPFTHEQLMQVSIRRKRWFMDKHVTEERLRNKIACMIETMANMKRQLGDCPKRES